MAVTIKDIAKLSGVSAGTVDRVLNNRGKVKPEVYQRVRGIAEALNYRPNTVAKSLALRRNPATIGVISHVQPTFSNYAVEKAFEGIDAAQKEIRGSGIAIRMEYAQDFNDANQVALIDQLVEEGIAALAIAPINTKTVCEKIASLSIPVFCFTNDIPEEYPHYFIGIDNYKTGSIAAGLFYMINRRLEKMAIVSSSLSMYGNATRLQGFQDRLEEYYGRQIVRWQMEAVNDDYISYKKIDAILHKHPDIDSLFFMSGAVTGGLQAIQEAGILGKIPIVAIDLAEPVKENLQNRNIAATIHQNSYLHGYNAIKCISDYIISGVLPKTQQIYVASEIIIRDSLPV